MMERCRSEIRRPQGTKKRPKVVIIVLNWNNYEDTKESFGILGGDTYPKYEVDVIRAIVDFVG